MRALDGIVQAGGIRQTADHVQQVSYRYAVAVLGGGRPRDSYFAVVAWYVSWLKAAHHADAASAAQ